MAPPALADQPVTAFLQTTSAGRARDFYQGMLGLTCLSQDDFDWRGPQRGILALL